MVYLHIELTDLTFTHSLSLSSHASLNLRSLSTFAADELRMKSRPALPLVAALVALLVLPAAVSSRTLNSTTSSKYQIECTMCAACENPCGQNPSPPPPSPPPPTPSSPANCPPPPSPPSSSGGTYYYSPPPPSQPTYTYPPPNSGGGTYIPPPSDDGKNYPGPPPPNPIVPYFPFYYYNPPPPKSGSAHLRAGSFASTAASLILIVRLF